MAEVVEFDWYPSPLVIGAQFDEIADELEALEIPLTLSLPEVSAAIQRNFETEGQGGWPYWSDKYAPFAETHNEGILIQSGDLISGATSEEALAIVDDSIIWTGEGVPEQWEWHEEGRTERTTKAGAPNPLPARPFIGLDEPGEAAITAIFLAWLDAIASGGGLKRVSVGKFGSRLQGVGGRFVKG